ncbi:MAG: WGR domain-containing protein [Glaciecola sp.]
MLLFKKRESNKTQKSFMFYIVQNNGTELVIRSGTCGEKVKELVKKYSDDAQAKKAYKKLMENKLKANYFECEGDENGPLIKPPFDLSPAPQDFSERLSKLSDLGIYVAPHTHKYADFDDIYPIYSIPVTCSSDNELEIIVSVIKDSREILEILALFKKDEIEIQQYTNEQWEKEIIAETQCNSDWKVLDKKDINLGIIRKMDGLKDIEFYLDIVNNKNIKSYDHLVQLDKHYQEYSEIKEAIEDRLEQGYSNINEIAKLFIHNPEKQYTQLMSWLFDDVSVSVYELTTSSMYACIGRTEAIVLFLIKGNMDKTHIFFHKVIFEC